MSFFNETMMTPQIQTKIKTKTTHNWRNRFFYQVIFFISLYKYISNLSKAKLVCIGYNLKLWISLARKDCYIQVSLYCSVKWIQCFKIILTVPNEQKSKNETKQKQKQDKTKTETKAKAKTKTNQNQTKPKTKTKTKQSKAMQKQNQNQSLCNRGVHDLGK